MPDGSLSKAQRSVPELRNTRQHFSTTLGVHFKQRNNKKQKQKFQTNKNKQTPAIK